MNDLEPHLATERYGRARRCVEETASTNDDARIAALEDDAPDGFMVSAERQTKGRGAHGRSWSSPAGTDLYLSIIARRLPRELSALPPLTLAIGLAVALTVEHFLDDQEVRVKWPNDVWLGDRKCAGILVETVSQGSQLRCVIIGIGLNVNRLDFDASLAETATSMAKRRGHHFDRSEVLAWLLRAVEQQVDRFTDEGPSAIVREVEARLAFRDERVATEDSQGTLRGLSAEGSLILEEDGVRREIRSGTLRRA